jgi:DNA polymerase-3 subunit delta
MISERANRLAATAVSDISDPFVVTRLEADAIARDPALLIDGAGAMPPFGGKRLVMVNQAGSAVLKACKALIENPPPESITIITADSEINTRSALVKAFESSPRAAAMGCYADTGQSLAAMAKQVFDDASVTVDRDTMQWIVDHLGADRMASRSEIEKLVLLAGQGGHLDLASVREALGDGASIATSDIVKAAASGNRALLSKALERAVAEKITGENIIRAAMGYFHRLFRLSASIEEGMSRDQAFKSIKPPVFFSERDMMEGHLRHWSAQRCQRAIARLAEAEIQSRKGVDSTITAAQALISLSLAVRR